MPQNPWAFLKNIIFFGRHFRFLGKVCWKNPSFFFRKITPHFFRTTCLKRAKRAFREVFLPEVCDILGGRSCDSMEIFNVYLINLCIHIYIYIFLYWSALGKYMSFDGNC